MKYVIWINFFGTLILAWSILERESFDQAARDEMSHVERNVSMVERQSDALSFQQQENFKQLRNLLK